MSKARHIAHFQGFPRIWKIWPFCEKPDQISISLVGSGFVFWSEHLKTVGTCGFAVIWPTNVHPYVGVQMLVQTAFCALLDFVISTRISSYRIFRVISGLTRSTFLKISCLLKCLSGLMFRRFANLLQKFFLRISWNSITPQLMFASARSETITVL